MAQAIDSLPLGEVVVKGPNGPLNMEEIRMQAIGFPIAAKVVESAASAGVIEAQLSRYQTQLADWCNCPSGKTPAGKEKIQELQDKVDAAKAQLEKMATVKAQRQSTSGRGNSSTDELPTSAARRVTGTSIGGSVDVFA